MTIRDATLSDAPRIAAIHNASILARDATMETEPRSDDEVARWIQTLGERESVLVLEEDAQVQGWGVVKPYSPRPGYARACETSVYLDRAERGRGLGRRLQEALHARCRALGYHHVVAKIWASNAASIAMHHRLGFRTVGIQHEIGWVDGRWQDVAILERVLGDEAPANDPSF